MTNTSVDVFVFCVVVALVLSVAVFLVAICLPHEKRSAILVAVYCSVSGGLWREKLPSRLESENFLLEKGSHLSTLIASQISLE